MERTGPFHLDGNAARFKGGRTYVHGTDLIGHLDGWAARALQSHVSKIEFKRPLEKIGVLMTSDSETAWDPDMVSCAGTFDGPNGQLDFVLFESPFAISQFDPFDEAPLLDATDTTKDGCAGLPFCEGATVMEHASSAMKKLCSTLLPEHGRWWFARCSLNRSLPSSFQHVEMEKKRIMAKTLVTSTLRIDGSEFGEMVFVGAKK